ncbi:MAG: hypothetical protein HFE81_06760 [Bacilli bacterium]|nr:hypothetical protein [Bacilli bacterium]
MKKLISPVAIILLLVVSFYYTNKSVSVLRNADPIMKELKSTEKKYKINPINAQIIGENIISGKNGKTIDYEKSYNKMKRYGTYNESLTALKELQPVISINDNYDKYIVSGNKKNRNIALVFKVKNNENIINVLSILKSKNVVATFFLDGTYLEKNITTIRNISNHELEILSYNNEFEEAFIKTSISYLNSLTGKSPKYCYTEESNEEILNTCEKLNLHTIKPTLVLSKNIYHEIKNNLSNSIIISLEVNNYVEKELSTTIDYLKKKGYKIVSLDNALKEEN